MTMERDSDALDWGFPWGNDTGFAQAAADPSRGRRGLSLREATCVCGDDSTQHDVAGKCLVTGCSCNGWSPSYGDSRM